MSERVDRETLLGRLIELNSSIPIGSVWQHYKGGCYQVLNLALLESDVTPVVVYKAYDDSLPITFVRPASDWLGYVGDPEDPRRRYLRATNERDDSRLSARPDSAAGPAPRT